MVKEDILIKDSSIFSFGSHCVQLNRTKCAILVEGIMGNNPPKFGTIVQEEMSFKSKFQHHG